MRSVGLLLLALSLATGSAHGRGGGPLPGLSATELAEFKEGFDAFRTSLSRDQGLGPAYNLASCYPCHGHPALGGQSPKTVTRFGRADGDVFQALDSAGGSLLQQKAISSDCAEVIPAAANVVTPLGWFYPFASGDVTAIETACRQARVTLHGTGIHPGGITERFPLMLSKGMVYLAHLLAAPAEHVSAVDLAGVPSGGDAGERLDTRARAAVQERARDVEGELAEAERANDLGRVELLRTELDALTEELAHSRGLAGRSRRLGSVAERARVNVTRRIAASLQKIATVHPAAARYLETTMRTGTACVFLPDPRFPVSWIVRPRR